MENESSSNPTEINTAGKVAAGILLVLFTLAPIWLIMAYWPSSMPDPNAKNKIKPLYIDELYHIRLACIPDSACCADTFWVKNAVVDTNRKKNVDTITAKADSSIKPAAGTPSFPEQHYYTKSDLIDLGTLMLILIAAAGFLGNMIHIATSFTTFVGNNQFKRSWILWYSVRPFTASGLALGLYFVFRGGFLNYNADAAGINLYGILTISVLAGLFTDKATNKLAEIFEVVFGSKKGDNRADKLENTVAKITAISPDKLETGKENTITITGENLDKSKLIFKINEEVIDREKITITPKIITVLYTIPSSQTGKTAFKLQVLDEKNKELFPKVFSV
jgi:hypothetical protein